MDLCLKYIKFMKLKDRNKKLLNVSDAFSIIYTYYDLMDEYYLKADDVFVNNAITSSPS